MEPKKEKAPPVLAILLPAYNEGEVIRSTISRLVELLEKMSEISLVARESYICFVDDGSHDNTWNLIREAHSEDSRIKGIKLSRNFGHQEALLAGLNTLRNRADCLICLDADLQQDPGAIPEFVNRYLDGADIVLGIRRDRKADSLTKRLTALAFYKLMNMLGAKTVPNHADYRLMSQRALNILAEFNETNLFLRGIVNEIGLKTSEVYFDVLPRSAGATKYSFAKMLSFSLRGITSFSVVPLRLVTMIGLSVFLLSIIMVFYVFAVALLSHKAIPGWASIVIPVYFLGGIQLLSIGVIGEYLGMIFIEVKKRPRFIKETELL